MSSAGECEEYGARDRLSDILIFSVGRIMSHEGEEEIVVFWSLVADCGRGVIFERL